MQATAESAANSAPGAARCFRNRTQFAGNAVTAGAPARGRPGRVPGIAGMHDVADYPNARTMPGCMFYRYDAPLFFANIGDLRERVEKLLDIENETYPDDPVRWFVLNVEANVEIDFTAADGLRELGRELADHGIHLGLARVKNDVHKPLDRAGVIESSATRCCSPPCLSPSTVTCAGPSHTNQRHPRKNRSKQSRTNPQTGPSHGRGKNDKNVRSSNAAHNLSFP
jgi:MFS superfamily sulfate permease-like transporter